MYEQYQKGHLATDIDLLSAKLVLAIPEQESAEALTTTASKGIADIADQSGMVTSKPTADVTAWHSVNYTLVRYTNLTQLQHSLGPNYIVIIALVRSYPIYSIQSSYKIRLLQGDNNAIGKELDS